VSSVKYLRKKLYSPRRVLAGRLAYQDFFVKKLTIEQGADFRNMVLFTVDVDGGNPAIAIAVDLETGVDDPL
jgi:high-affinity K+ transport system ATPase subunit B